MGGVKNDPAYVPRGIASMIETRGAALCLEKLLLVPIQTESEMPLWQNQVAWSNQ